MPTTKRHEPEYLSSATLIILGPNLNPSDVSAALRMRPSDSWERGTPKMVRGRTVGTALHERGGWKKSLPPSQIHHSLERQLAHWERTLRKRAEGFVRLAAMGCTCELNCYVGTSATATVSLSPELQTAIGKLALTLSIDVWACP